MSEREDVETSLGLLAPDFDKAMAALPVDLRIERPTVEIRLQYAAVRFAHTRQALSESPEMPPSEAERRLGGVASQIVGVRECLLALQANDRLFADWCRAAESLAHPDHGIYPPHVAPDLIDLPPSPSGEPRGQLEVWPTDRALTEILRSLEYANAVAQRATEQASAKKRDVGGAKPDEAAYDLVYELGRLYQEATGEKPDEPSRDRITGKWKGTFLDFIEPVFVALDGRNRDALASLLWRIRLSDALPPWPGTGNR